MGNVLLGVVGDNRRVPNAGEVGMEVGGENKDINGGLRSDLF